MGVSVGDGVSVGGGLVVCDDFISNEMVSIAVTGTTVVGWGMLSIVTAGELVGAQAVR